MSARNILLATLVIVIAVIIGLMVLIYAVLNDDEPDQVNLPPAAVSGRPTPLPYDYIPPELATRLPTQNAPSYLGSPVPDYAVQTLDGNPVRLTDFAGKVVVLNFWASWCVPCQEELPLLQNYARNSGDDVQVIALTNPNNGQTIGDVESFLQTYGITDLLVVLDQHNALHSTFGVLVLPSTYFIDPDGTVKRYIPGVLTVTEVDQFVRELQNS
jgi:thiol-disulfide isomerase/thioredoxin